MLMRCFPVFLLFGLLIFSHPARAQTVSVPAGLYTLDDLAAKLSTPDAPVKATPRIARRFGFACLKAHTQSEALHVVEMAFALKANRASAPEKGFVLDEDPEVVRRERRWTNRFVARMEAQVREDVEDLSALVQLSPEELAHERDKRNREQSALIGKYPAHSPSGQIYADAFQRYQRAFDAKNNQDRLASALAYLKAKQNLPVLIANAVRSGAILRGETVPAASGVGDPAFVVTHARFERTWGHYWFEFSVNTTAAAENDETLITEFGEGYLIDVLFGSVKKDGQDKAEVYAPALGRDAGAWMAKERAQTEAFLALPPVWQAFDLNTALPSDAVSSWVWQWCVAQDKEALVEIFPTVDGTQAQGKSLADVIRYQDQWSAKNENGIAIITNRLAFLDRNRAWNFSALQYWVQAREKSAKVSVSPTTAFPIANVEVFPVSLLAPFAERSWEENYVSWGYPGIANSRTYGYYHLLPHDLDNAAAIGLLWKNRPASQRNLPIKRTEISLDAFDAATLQRLAQWFDATGTAAARHPDFIKALRQSGRFVLEPSQNAKTLKASVVFADPKSPFIPKSLPRLTITLEQ